MLLLALLCLGRAVLCPAVPDDGASDDEALQNCLDSGGAIELKPGIYDVAKGLSLTLSNTRLTGPATLRATPDFLGTLLNANANGFSLRHLTFDGNADARVHRNDCGGALQIGPNLILQGSGFRVFNCTSTRAMCGSACVVLASEFSITYSRFVDNGRPLTVPPSPGTPWSDGVTALLCDRGTISNNYFEDNTDIGLVLGGGKCRVENNAFFNWKKHGFAALNVGNFNNNGDHTGSVFRGNTVTSNSSGVVWGLLVGSHPWDVHVQVHNCGSFESNHAQGAFANLVVDGVEAGTVVGNTYAHPQGISLYGNCTGPVNYAACDAGAAATIQPGFVRRCFQDGTCPAARRAVGAAKRRWLQSVLKND